MTGRAGLRRVRAIAAVGMLASAAALAGCNSGFFNPSSTGSGGGNGSGGSGASAVYVANENTSLNSVAAFSLTNGKLANLANSPSTVPVTPMSLAISSKTNLLYVGSQLGGIFAYVIASDGSLTLNNSSNAPADNRAVTAMAVDPTGQWLLALADVQASSGTTPTIYIDRIDTSNGSLTQTAQINLSGGTSQQLQFAPNGTQLYAALGAGGIGVLTFNPSQGTLNALSGPPTASNSIAKGLAIDPAGKYLFAAETGLNGLRVYGINTDSTLTELSTSPVIDSTNPLGAVSVLVDKTGSYVYVANQTSNNISAYTLASTGTLTQIAGAPFATGSVPVSLAEDSSGGYLAVACEGGSPDLQIFSIASGTGVLAPVSTGTTGTPSPAAAIAVAVTP